MNQSNENSQGSKITIKKLIESSEPMNSSTMSKTFNLKDLNTPLPNIDEIFTSVDLTHKKTTLPLAEQINSDNINSDGETPK